MPTITPSLSERFGVELQEDPATGRKFFLWDDMFQMTPQGMPLPNFSVQEAAKSFFARSSDWLRWRYREAKEFPDGYFVLDGVVLEPKRNPKGQRYYTLADIERMAHALAQTGAIDGEMFANIMETVLNVARLYEVFDRSEE